MIGSLLHQSSGFSRGPSPSLIYILCPVKAFSGGSQYWKDGRTATCQFYKFHDCVQSSWDVVDKRGKIEIVVKEDGRPTDNVY